MTSPKHYQAVAEEAILDHFRNPEHEPFHSDDLWHVIPDQHRGVISLAVMALVNKRLMVGCGYRKSAIPSRKRSPSQEYRLTELGRDRIVGVSAGASSNRVSPASGDAGEVSIASADPGEPQRRPTGVPGEKFPDRSDKPEPVPSASDQSSPVAESTFHDEAAGETLSLLPDPDPEAWAA